MQRYQLTSDYSISRVIKGGWHLAGGHGNILHRDALADMRAFVEAGITTFDCADIYTGVEELIGQFLKSHNGVEVQVHTKYVPDYDALASLKKEDTEKIIDRSLQRLGVERLDLVQFAWWDYQFPGYVETALHLLELQDAGKIRFLGITNFDTAHVAALNDAGIRLLSNQVQYSVLDQRVAHDQPLLSETLSIPYLCYGTVAGGFLSDAYLDQPEPNKPLENRSLTKYRLIIEEFGSWELFQELLKVLRRVADQYEVGIGEVACQYILQLPNVAGVIVGARNARHLQRLKQLDTFQLNESDMATIQAIIGKGAGPKGPFYALERDKTGKHGAIMKYNLNKD
ncbi:MAG: aldo/keto reductase [Cytophagales bacterium]|nr:aldo/keto reductase [Cytophagales bacterium]